MPKRVVVFLWASASVLAMFAVLPASCFAKEIQSQAIYQLPKTNLDSFVRQAGERAWEIYGDDQPGSVPPPLFGYDETRSIESGIQAGTQRLLTTGHLSALPNARDQLSFTVEQPAVPPLPISPGPGWWPEFINGKFVGYLSPEQDALYARDPQAALQQFVDSGNFVGTDAEKSALINQFF